jgi:diguanylate cyclase (GGDEF)-like protein
LPNRNLLSDRAKLALSAAERGKTSVALMYLDLDRFKIVNESLGLSVGDALLKELAKRLLNELRPEDTVCRQGGDEFIMLLPDTDAEGAAHVAKKLLDIVAKPFTFAEQRITLTSSIGIAEFPQDGDNFEQLTQSADAALYRAKQSGRNNFQFFTQQMHVQAYKVLQIENELRQALEQNEFELYYQPQIDTVTKEIIGAEALIRWQHPIKGLVMPSSFIPVAEESSLINEIGNWVLVSALKQLAKWQAKGIAIVPVAVNLSIVQFRQDSLYESICNALQETKLDPAMLELEMTESIAMEDSERTIRVLSQLSALGVNLSIDDFGTGYSSLSYLKRFKIDKLKIDQSFIREMENHPEDAAIIVAIIGMAKALKFKTIAEGVETEQQLAYLLQNHCDEIQGLLFSNPVPAKHFELLLRNGTISLQ